MGWKESAGSFECGMACLYELLSGAQIAPHENVNVRPLPYLTKVHETSIKGHG